MAPLAVRAMRGPAPAPEGEPPRASCGAGRGPRRRLSHGSARHETPAPDLNPRRPHSCPAENGDIACLSGPDLPPGNHPAPGSSPRPWPGLHVHAGHRGPKQAGVTCMPWMPGALGIASAGVFESSHVGEWGALARPQTLCPSIKSLAPATSSANASPIRRKGLPGHAGRRRPRARRGPVGPRARRRLGSALNDRPTLHPAHVNARSPPVLTSRLGCGARTGSPGFAIHTTRHVASGGACGHGARAGRAERRVERGPFPPLTAP